MMAIGFWISNVVGLMVAFSSVSILERRGVVVVKEKRQLRWWWW